MNDFRGQVLLILSFVTVSLLLLPSAGAQTDRERAGARSTATDGISAFNEGNYEEALKLFQRAESVMHAPTHLLLIARSQEKLGMLLESVESYQKLIGEKLPKGAPQAFVNAQATGRAEKAEVAKRIPKLTIVVDGPPEVALVDLVVKVDGEVLNAALIGISVPINPGKHEVSAVAEGMDPSTQSVELSEVARDELRITLLAVATPAVVAAVAAEPTEEEEVQAEPSDSNSRKTWGWVSVGTGAALVGTGAVFGIMSLNEMSTIGSDPALCGIEDTCTTEGWNQKNAAQTKALVADISIGVGLVAVGVGTYLLLTGKKSSPGEVGVHHVVPSVGKEGGFLSLQGAF